MRTSSAKRKFINYKNTRKRAAGAIRKNGIVDEKKKHDLLDHSCTIKSGDYTEANTIIEYKYAFYQFRSKR